QFHSNLLSFSFRYGIHNIPLFMDDAPLAWCRRKLVTERCKNAFVSICDDQINLLNATRSQVVEQASPPIFAFFGARTQGEDFSLALLVNPKRRENHSRVALFSMT